MKSLWADSTQKPHFKGLNGDIKTDVLIIGGGLTGILCAYILQKAGIDYTLIEAKEICSGITKNTTAKLTVQHGLIYDKIIRKYGVTAAQQYYNANNNALSHYREICKTFDCGFEEKDAYVYTLYSREKIEKEINAYKTIGINAELVKNIPLPFNIAGAVKLVQQGQFHPLEFLYKLSKNLNINEHTKLQNFMPHLAQTDRGNIHFKKAIMATHFPIINKHGSYFLKMYQHRSYVIALKNAPNVDGMYIDDDIKGLSFRNYGEYLLIGGGSHRTGKNGGSFAELEMFAKKFYPSAQIKYSWATQDCMTLDGIPYIGNYSALTPDLYLASGFNKWGMTNAMAAAMLLSDLISEKGSEFADVFSPSRSILKPQLLINGYEAITNIINFKPHRCTHMGCALKWNKQEHTWDCPCHGSRFEETGEILENPAMKKLQP